MSPSKLVRRAGIVSGIATGTFVIAMAASPAYAIGTPTLGVGSVCPPPSLASLIPDGLECVNGVLVTITSQLPLPTAAPTKAPASPAPSPTPNPLTGLVGGVTGTVTQTVTGVTAPISGLLGSGGTSLPGTPGTPSSSPSSPPAGTTGSGAGSTSNTGGKSGSGSAAKPTSTADGSSLLGPAAAFLPGLGVAGFTDLGTSPLADSIPSPLLAAPETKLAAVQAPLIAAGEQAAKSADSSSPFARFVGNKALPGLLIVIATAMVAAVGAGNLRAWQARLAMKRK